MRLAVLAAALLLPFASLDAQSKRAETERARPFAAFSASASALRDSIVARAKAQVGTRYVRGGSDPAKGFDCSGLVKFVMGAFSLDLPRTARQQARVGGVVARSAQALKPGDLLTFGNSKKGVDHIGIYIGEGRYIHASSVTGKVIESPLDRRGRRIKPWLGARRLLAVSDSAPDGN